MGELLCAVCPFFIFQNGLTNFQNGCIIEIEGIAEEGQQNTLFRNVFLKKGYITIYCLLLLQTTMLLAMLPK